jgi:peptide/nickel transport system substrate-binding protein
MEESYWIRRWSTRRDFIHGIGAAAGALALAPAIAACRTTAKRSTAGNPATNGSAAQPVRGGTLTSSLGSDVSSLDYAFNTDGNSKVIIANCVEPLLTVNTRGQPAGLLATSWENPDDRTYVFKLRPGVTFQDGTDFDADAVDYSMRRIRANKASFQYPQLVYIDKIDNPDRATVKLTLSSPYAPLLSNLADNAGRVISPVIGEKYGNDRLKVDLTGEGTGPFKFVEWRSGDHVTLVRNERYWGRDAAGTQLPYADRLIYRVIPDTNQTLASLRSGDLDAFSLAVGAGSAPPKDIAGLKADPSLSYRDSLVAGNLHTLFFNQAKEPFGSREVRQAISVAIDRAALTHAVFFDTAMPLDVIFSSGIWAYDDAYHPYLKRDLSRAKQLLVQAGRPNGFAFTLITRNDPPNFPQVAELIKDQLREIGIDVRIQLVDPSALAAALKAGDHQVAYQPGPVVLDPDSLVYPYYSSKGALNSNTRYGNIDVDRLLEQAGTTLDPSARKPLYQQAQKLILDDAAVCVLLTPQVSALSRANVHNVPLGPTPAVGASQVWKTG